MDDKELIELAAKAAGIELKWSTEKDLAPRRVDTWNAWSPLTDDADALRLAIKLRIHIEWAFTHPRRPELVQASPKGLGHCSDIQPLGDDPYAATRRAIVSAAAEIGKQMDE